MTKHNSTSSASTDFAEERSHRDAEASNETGKATAQAAILINGGAATAVLAYLAKDGLAPIVMCVVPSCLACYGVGVVLGAFMLHFRMRALDEYSVRWARVAISDTTARIEDARANAFKYWKYSHLCFVASMLAFTIASFVLAGTLTSSKPS